MLSYMLKPWEDDDVEEAVQIPSGLASDEE